MQKSVGKYEMDMTQGPILKNMILFSVPLMFSGALQLFYNAADMIVVGRFAGSGALAAVGATNAVTMLLVNFFMGLSVGVSVIVGQHYGAKDYDDISDSVHTSVTLGFLVGLLLAVLGISLARPLLIAMGTPGDILNPAVLYMQIYFAGMPANLTYNFSSSILRAVGDTRRPLYYLSISGLVNVLLNLFFVIVLHMSVAGVALATIASQAVSMTLVLRCLIRTEGYIHLDLKRLRLQGRKALEIIRIGVPSGLQASMFAISNTLIHSAINTFGSAAVAGQAASQNIEHFITTPVGCFSQAAQSFTSQNYGARKPERFGQITRCSVLITSVAGFSLCFLAVLFAKPLVGIYTTDPAAIEWGALRMQVVTTFCTFSCIGNIFVGCLRGMGNSTFPMLTSILCTCVFRVSWVWIIFGMWPTPMVLYAAYSLSFILSAISHTITYIIHKRKVTLRLQQAT